MARQRARRRDVVDHQPPACDRKVAGERARDSVAPRRRAAERQRRVELRNVGRALWRAGRLVAAATEPVHDDDPAPGGAERQAVGEAAGLSRDAVPDDRRAIRRLVLDHELRARDRRQHRACDRGSASWSGRRMARRLSAKCSSRGAPARTGFCPLRTARNCTLRPGWLPSSVRARGVSVTAKVRCVPGCIRKRSGGAAVQSLQRGISKCSVPAQTRSVQPSFTSAPVSPPVASRPPITCSGL